jgi:peptidyl-prolyl cis-trans isomerase D
MPVMTKMRDSMPVVFAVLAGIFLLMIIFQWGGQGTLFSPKGETGTLGTVNGYPITQQDYNKFLEAATAQIKSKNKEENLSESEESEASDDAWDQAVSSAIADQSIEKMGISVANEEVRDMLFNSPPTDVKQRFTDSTGTFHQDAYIKALRDPRNDSGVRLMEASARDQIKQMKWQQAMASTIRVTDTEAFLRYMSDSAKAIVQIVKILAPQVTPQMAAQVSDKEIQAYYDSHSWLYHQEEERKLKFVRFPLVPNGRDTALVIETANTLKARLAETTDTPVGNLDTVVKELSQDYSDVPFTPRHLVDMSKMGNDTSLLSAKAGDNVIAKVDGKITALRVIQVFDTGGHVLFHMRHILIGYPKGVVVPTPQQSDSVHAIVSQIIQQLKSGADFGELARTRSSDPRTVEKGGDMGWLDTATLPVTYRSAIGSTATGEFIGPMESPRGLDIVQVLQHTRNSWAITGVPLLVKPSHQTLDLESQMANIFRDQAEKVGFDQAATASGYHVIANGQPATRKGSPIFSSHLFADWLFDASKGDVSQPFRLLKAGAMVVAQLTDIIPAGPKPLADVKQSIAQDLALRKAVAALAPRAQQVLALVANGDLSIPAATTSDPSLAPITALMGPAESVNGLPGTEYVINNWAFSAQPGAVSPILKGEHGYYIAKLTGRNIPTQKEFAAAKPNVVKQIMREREQRLLSDWLDNQKEHATIEDFRYKH